MPIGHSLSGWSPWKMLRNAPNTPQPNFAEVVGEGSLTVVHSPLLREHMDGKVPDEQNDSASAEKLQRGRWAQEATAGAGLSCCVAAGLWYEACNTNEAQQLHTSVP